MQFLKVVRKMDDIQVSKHFKNGQHNGFRKHILGKMFHLVTGTTPAHEAKAKAIAARLVAHAEHLRKVHGVWTDAAIEEAYDVSAADIEDAMPAQAIEQPPEQPLTHVIAVNTPSTLTALIPAALPVVVPVPVVARKVAAASAAKDSIWLYDAMEMFKQAELLREKINDTGTFNAQNYIFRIEWSKEGITDLGFPTKRGRCRGLIQACLERLGANIA